MCKYSLEGYATRRTTQGETLVANKHEARGHGCFTQPSTTNDGALTCVRHGQKLTIEKLELNKNVRVGDMIRNYGVHSTIVDYIGKRVVVQMLDGNSQATAMDCLRIIGSNVKLPLAFVAPGTEAYVGVKAAPETLEQKLHLDAKTLRSVAIDHALVDPNPKPDDEEKKSDEPAKEGDEKKEEVSRLTHEPVSAWLDTEPPARPRSLIRRWDTF